MPIFKTLRAKVAIQLFILLFLPLGMLVTLASMAGSYHEFANLLGKDSQAQNFVIFLCLTFTTLAFLFALLFTSLHNSKAFRLILFAIIVLLAAYSLLHGFLPALASVFAIYYTYRWYREV